MVCLVWYALSDLSFLVLLVAFYMKIILLSDIVQ